VVDLGEAQWATDSVKVKSQLLRAFKYFIEYSANVKNDRPAAVAWCDRYLTKDPNDIEVINFRKALSGPAPKTTKPATPAKPTGSTQPKATTTGATKPPVAVTKSAPKTTTVPVKKK
jgi:hypothetical protein